MLNVAQPALSRCVKQLEKELGVKLFKRVGRNIALTEEGKLFYDEIAPALEKIHAAEEKLKTMRGQMHLKLRILAASSFLRGFYSCFVQQYPEISFHLMPQNEENDYDICIASPEDKIAGAATVLLEETMLLAVAKGHPLAANHEITLQELAEFPFVMYNNGFSMRSVTDHILAAAHIKPKIAYECDNNASFVSVLSSGEVVALVPDKTMPNISTDSFVKIRIKDNFCVRKVLLHCKTKNRATALFKKACIEYFKRA